MEPTDGNGKRYDTVIVGGGQAGLAVGYHLQRLGRQFVILDAGQRCGDSWRGRWDSLRLFTPAWADQLPGMPFPGPRGSCPTKDEMADYLDSYAARFDLPVQRGVRVDGLSRHDGLFRVSAGRRHWTADNVVVAMSIWQDPARPGFAAELDPDIVALHSAEYRNPAQLRGGDVLVVGASNSGAEIALDLASTHRVWLSGRHPGQVPFRIDGLPGRLVLVRLVLRFVFHRVMTNRTPPGRRMRAYLKRHGMILVRTKLADLDAAGVQRVGRVTGIRDGRPELEDGRVLDVAGVVWATGYRPGWSWIDLPVFDDDGYPVHRRGIATAEPGLAFVGFPFVRAASGAMIHGLWTDARHIAEHIATRDAGGRRAAPAGSAAARVTD